ncbi:MAG: GrpB family protein [Candidatus Woesebacteria bacterium]|nr:GrpB family protein [Candidatus Woesebacteria bacterium]
MLTKDEKDFLNKIPRDKIVNVSPFDNRITRTVNEIVASINKIFPDLEIKHMGASALKISGQNDIDIYAFSKPSDFNKYLPNLVKLFDAPLHQHKTFIEWKFKRNGFDIELYLSTKDSETMKRQLTVFRILSKNDKLLNEYRKLKEDMNGKSFREYQRKKYEFYHKILDTNSPIGSTIQNERS